MIMSHPHATACKRAQVEATVVAIPDLPIYPEARVPVDHEAYAIELEMQIEALRCAQEVLALERRRYADLFNLAPAGYLSLDGQGRIVEANNTAACMLGIVQGRLHGRLLSRYFPIADQDIWRHLRQALLTSRARQSCDIRMVKDGGCQFWVRLEGIAAQYNGHAVCRLAINEIIGRLQEETLVDQAMHTIRSAFLSTVSHELRTPLNVIIGMSHLLRRPSRFNRDHTRLIDMIQGAGETLRHVIDDILDLAKIESGYMKLKCLPVDLGRLAREIRKYFLATITAKGLNFDISIASDLDLPVSVDPQRMRQILVNLVDNAIKFTSHGTVTLDIRRETDALDHRMIVYEITDTGIGIPMDYRPRLFKPFTQADASTTRNFGGTGLGLAIVKHLVDLMDGAITVNSVIGSGTVFRAAIPERSFVPHPEAQPAP